MTTSVSSTPMRFKIFLLYNNAFSYLKTRPNLRFNTTVFAVFSLSTLKRWKTWPQTSSMHTHMIQCIRTTSLFSNGLRWALDSVFKRSYAFSIVYVWTVGENASKRMLFQTKTRQFGRGLCLPNFEVL